MARSLSICGLHLSAIGFLLFACSADTCFACVIYEYRWEGSATVIGTLEIESPPASATSRWSTFDQSNLIALFLDDEFFGVGSGNLLLADDGFGSAGSITGAGLDGGIIGINFPPVVPSDPLDPTIEQRVVMEFAVAERQDFIGIASYYSYPDGRQEIADGFVYGDWVAQGTAVIPEPGSLTLLGAGLLGIGWMGYRKHSRR